MQGVTPVIDGLHHGRVSQKRPCHVLACATFFVMALSALALLASLPVDNRNRRTHRTGRMRKNNILRSSAYSAVEFESFPPALGHGTAGRRNACPYPLFNC
jgi:hypothetical protein